MKENEPTGLLDRARQRISLREKIANKEKETKEAVLKTYREQIEPLLEELALNSIKGKLEPVIELVSEIITEIQEKEEVLMEEEFSSFSFGEDYGDFAYLVAEMENKNLSEVEPKEATITYFAVKKVKDDKEEEFSISISLNYESENGILSIGEAGGVGFSAKRLSPGDIDDLSERIVELVDRRFYFKGIFDES